MKTLIYVKTTNDVDGNPRRGWIVTWMDNLFVDEGGRGRWSLYHDLGYGGQSEISKYQRLELDQSVNEITINVTVGEYKRLKRGA